MARFAPSLLVTDAAERARFVDALRATGTITAAARVCRVSVATVGRLRRSDPDFAAACAAVIGDPSAHVLEVAFLARLTEGVERYRFYANDRVDMWREYDDALAFTVLKRLWPAKWGDAAATSAPARAVMTRAEFIAAIRAQPRLDPLGPGDD